MTARALAHAYLLRGPVQGVAQPGTVTVPSDLLVSIPVT
jgi:hypothetical protein